VGSLRGNIFVWLFIPVRLMGLHGVITHDTTWSGVVHIEGDIVIGPGEWIHP